MVENKQISSPQFGLDAKWDACLDLGLRRFVYSSIAGAVGGLLLFRSPVTRWASVAFGAGVGIGSACTDCSYKFDQSPGKLPSTKILDTPTFPTKAAKKTPPKDLPFHVFRENDPSKYIWFSVIKRKMDPTKLDWIDRIETMKLFKAFSQDSGSKSDFL